MLGHAPGDVCVVVLNLHERQAQIVDGFVRELGRQVLRVQITDQQLWRVIVELRVEPQVFAVVVVGCEVLEIALVLREHGRTMGGHTKGGLLLGSIGQERRGVLEPGWQGDRPRGVAASPAKQARLPGGHAHDRVVDTVRYVTIVHQREIRDIA